MMLALSITSLILFATANLFPLVYIEALGQEHAMSVLSAVSLLIDREFYLVAFSVVLLVLVIPLSVAVVYLMATLLLRMRKRKRLVRHLLIMLRHLTLWSMADIYVVSVLIALVKLSEDVAFRLGVSFWAWILYVLIDTYLTKNKQLTFLWEQWEQIDESEK
jgi:paraquat-inducible protein A